MESKKSCYGQNNFTSTNEMNIPLLLEDLRVFIYGGIQTLPLTIAGLFLLLGLFSANYAYLFFLIGFLIVTPIFTIIVNTVFEPLADLIPFFNVKEKLTVKCSDQLQLVVPFGSKSSNSASSTQFVVSSYWLSMMYFFFGYVITNAISILNRETVIPDNIPEPEKENIRRKASNRKSSMILSIITIAIFALVVLYFRYSKTCESSSLWSIVPTLLIFSSLGVAWYNILATTGQDRLSDIFGIANRLLSPDALVNQPMACMPVTAN